MTLSSRALLAVLAAGLLVSVVPANATIVFDDFESYALGTFPSPTWSDVAGVDPIAPITPIPSAEVVSTTDAFGNTTQAVAFVDALGSAGGIYRSVPVSTNYSFGVDIRVDQFADNPQTSASDWAAQMGFVQNGFNYSFTPQVGIYASSLTQDWRLFAFGGSSLAVDLTLGVPVNLGQWYRVDIDFNALNGLTHSIIRDILTGTVLVDRFDVLSDGVDDWTTDGVPLDAIAIFDGELTGTTPNLAVFDNLGTAATTPEPATLLLLASGLLAVSFGRRKSV